MFSPLHSVDPDSWLLLAAITLLLGLSAYLGKRLFARQSRRNEAADDELKIVLGATLSLFGLLIGFILSFAINGYNTRVAAEENEAIAIGNAFQRTTLLDHAHQEQAEDMLNQYLQSRIQFFEANDENHRAQIRMQSIQIQTTMWTLIGRIAKNKPDPVIVTVLDAANDLYTAQQKTIASWRQQIPAAAWAMLLFFGVCSNFLIGYNVRGRKGINTLVLTMPVVTALTLFMIAEIDVPGKGMIHVTPDNLKAVQITVSRGGLAP